MPERAGAAAGESWRIVPVRDDADTSACARIMCSSDPWITLGRDYEKSLAIVQATQQERYVALDATGEVAGFVLLVMQGAFVGYVRSIAVRADSRSLGLGRALMTFAEARIFRETPNVFLCVSAFNLRARALYERLGYRVVGALPDYVTPGHTEWLLRKSIAAFDDFVPPSVR
ncbi:MAG: GNAT family N-acetyltransferase [Gemmatimonadota bacterium]